ncbi:GDSL ESTERASE/LIPASE [Salix viminalis]|uniref:GDSL ESTERASE/LIPASE n=1 Tax=Salix viminalis TaxID=40686 RepID=A0A9Q0UU35_SALVM|nr:GDSL ESTERASE/LIPASE [Salix viminalis]
MCNDWFSAIAIPVGAQFRDLDMTANSSNQMLRPSSGFLPFCHVAIISLTGADEFADNIEAGAAPIETFVILLQLSPNLLGKFIELLISWQKHGVTDLSSVGPPLLNQHNDAAGIGITVRKSNVIAMMAQSVSGLQKAAIFLMELVVASALLAKLFVNFQKD